MKLFKVERFEVEELEGMQLEEITLNPSTSLRVTNPLPKPFILKSK